MSEFIGKSIFAGILIGVAGYGNLTLGGIPGAIIFAFGLLSVCYMHLLLFTGKAGSVELKLKSVTLNLKDLAAILFFNIIGTMITALITSACITPDTALHVQAIEENRINAMWYATLCKAFMCGLIMEVAVRVYCEKSPLGIIFGVPLFILCGFYHCIADSYYMFFYAILTGSALPNALLGTLLLSIIGNFIGCNARRLFNC